jgi:WD40 repeat protein
VWDAASGERLHTFGQVDKPLTTALFSPDGKSILTANLTGGIYRFDAASYQLQDILPAESTASTPPVTSYRTFFRRAAPDSGTSPFHLTAKPSWSCAPLVR